ncbi:MAG: hypothetical protein ACRDV9_07145 [Acidimicrobiia bacterium]
MATEPGYQPTLGEWNHLLDRLGRVYRAEHARRTTIESELFPMNAYISMAHVEDYLQLPVRLVRITRDTAPEALLASGLRVGTKRNFINLAAMLVHYLGGREILIDLDEIDPASDLDDHLEVLEFWRRATIALRRDEVLLNSDTDPPNSSLVAGDDILAQVADELIPAEPSVAHAVRRFTAIVTAYCYLENCDSRLAVCDTGPYRHSPDRFLVLREMTTDAAGWFPWADEVRHILPHHNFVVAFELPVRIEMETNIWGTAWFRPGDYLAQATGMRVYETDHGRLTPLAMAELVPVTAAVRSAHRRLYRHFAEMSRRERAFAAAKMYAWKAKPWADAAGCLADIDWELSWRTAALYDRLADDSYARELLGGVLIPPDRPGCFRPLE